MQSWTLITGASEGLGAEFARIAAAEGRNLILTARSEDKLAALADELRPKAGDIIVIPADLNEADQVEDLWQAATQGRRIDMLVNNAGLGRHGWFSDGQGWDREISSLNVNIMALSYLMKVAIPHMKDHGGGRIMNLASTAAFIPGPQMAVYHASKAYVLSLTEAVADDLRGSTVSVTAVCPGTTQTSFFDAADMNGITLLKLAKPMSAQVVARTAWDATLKGKRIIVPGVLNKIIAFSPRLSPRWLITYVTGKITGKA